ncbi:MAG: right-handed parallel beta-helix repeat-containing protein [Planctomycetota bacterium]|nr:right-handed parallel beta-helix repeat-containing protein [Planctomycetota bacterium]
MIRKTTLFVCVLSITSIAHADEIIVRNPDSLRESLRDLKSGATLRIALGDFPGGHQVSGVDKLTVEALDPDDPPHFKGGSNAWHFSRCSDLTLRNVRISGQVGNGLNVDDGGLLDQPVTGITLDHIEISDIGPKGNHDGIKCSGLDKLTIRDCTISGWGG